MKKDLKILLLEDNADDVELLERELKKSGMQYTIQVADTREDFLKGLELGPDVILSDHSLPAFNSMVAFEEKNRQQLDIPFIMVTGTVSEEFAVECLKKGVDDYILKANLARLPNAIRSSLAKRRTEGERDEVAQKLQDKIKELNLFMYKATHDLRAPLTSIIGLSNIANSGKMDPAECVKMIGQCTQKLDTILISLLEVMAVRQGVPTYKKVDFNRLVENCLEKFRFLEAYDKITFKINDPENKKSLLSDEPILNSILQNCIENSIKYQNPAIANHCISITLSGTNSNIIEIADNGMGMTDEVKERVFDMFYRGNLGSDGSGLGLYIVKCCVETLGGKIELKSEVKKGTTVRIILPFANGN